MTDVSELGLTLIIILRKIDKWLPILISFVVVIIPVGLSPFFDSGSCILILGWPLLNPFEVFFTATSLPLDINRILKVKTFGSWESRSRTLSIKTATDSTWLFRAAIFSDNPFLFFICCCFKINADDSESLLIINLIILSITAMNNCPCLWWKCHSMQAQKLEKEILFHKTSFFCKALTSMLTYLCQYSWEVTLV